MRPRASPDLQNAADLACSMSIESWGKGTQFAAGSCDIRRGAVSESGRRVSNPPHVLRGCMSDLGHDLNRLDEQEPRRALSVHQDHHARESGAPSVHPIRCKCRPFVPAAARSQQFAFHS